MSVGARPFAAADWRALGCATRLAVTEPGALNAARQALAAWLAEVDAACSRFREDSEIVALDRSGGRATRVSGVLAEAVAAALRGAEQTAGDVDPTVGSALAALGYDRDFALVEQEGTPLKLTVRPVPGWRRIAFDPARRTLAVPAGSGSIWGRRPKRGPRTGPPRNWPGPWVAACWWAWAVTSPWRGPAAPGRLDDPRPGRDGPPRSRRSPHRRG